MRLNNISWSFCLISLAVALNPGSQSVFVTLPESAARSMIGEVREFILREEGIITHEFHFIKAFAVELPHKAVESLRAWGADRGLIIEEDRQVSINGDLKL